MNEISINQLPAPTWNWLHVNDRQIKFAEQAVQAEKQVTLPAGVTVYGGEGYLQENHLTEDELLAGLGLKDVPMSAGDELSSYVKASPVHTTVYQVEDGVTISEPLRIQYDYLSSEDVTAVDRIAIQLGKDAELTVVCLMNGHKGMGIQDIRIQAADYARLTLVQVYLNDPTLKIVSTIGGNYDAHAGLNLLQVVKTKGDLNIGCSAELNGEASYIDIDTGYLIEGNGCLDINYVARHRGCNTDSKIAVNGALKEQATKNFRGTIDFVKGCKNAKGDEREDILMIDPTVHNRTVPLILCAEEDVEGGHGASIGKLSDDIRFYFKSRGISEEAIVDLMARARIDAVAGRIPDEETRKLFLTEEE